MRSSPLVMRATACWLMMATCAAAATVNVDFGNGVLYSGQGAMPSAGDLWNSLLLAPAGEDTVSGLLTDSTGAATTVSVSIVGAAGEGNISQAGLANELVYDYFRGLDNDPASHLSLTIRGLTANSAYNLALYGVQDATFDGFLANNRGSTFDVGGVLQTSTADAMAWPAGELALGVTHVFYDGVLADNDGNIQVEISPYTHEFDAGFSVAFLNALQIDGAFEAPPPAIAGDFNGDGNVDGADFVIWQTNFPNNNGDATLATGDANGDGNVDGADFVVWQTNFPFTSTVEHIPVPEPVSVMQVLLGCAIALVRRQVFPVAKSK